MADPDPKDFSGATMPAADSQTMVASDATLAPTDPGVSAGPARVVVRKGGPKADYAQLIEVNPDHYSFEDELARGGMGRIVKAHDRRLGRGVAIKELLPGNDDSRFEREAKITAKLAHPAIVPVLEAGRWPTGEAFFAMKLVAGESLDKRIASCKTLAQRLALVPAVAAVVDALAYSHSEHVIHRDLKPANVLVGKYGETVVIDWGLAKDVSSSVDDIPSIPPELRMHASDGETIAGSVMGTPAYMPPEQADGSPVDERADVYALGALLYHVLAGKAPYTARNVEQVLAMVLEGPPKPLAELEPQIPIELVAIVEKAMARGRQYRFQNAGEMADELRRFQTGQLVSVHRYTFGELAKRWARKYRAPIAVGLIGVAALAIFGVISISKILTETNRADREAADARARADRGTIEHARALLDIDPTAAVATLQELAPGSREWPEARVIVADAEQRGVAHVYVGDGAELDDLDMSSDGAMLGGISKGNGLIAWDVMTGVKARWLSPGTTRGARWIANDLEFVADDYTVKLWHPFRGGVDTIATLPTASRVSISPNGRWIALTDIENTTESVFDMKTKQVIPIGKYYEVAWDGDSLVGFNNDNGVVFDSIDMASGRRKTLTTGIHKTPFGFVMHDHHLYGALSNYTIDQNGQLMDTGHRGEVHDLALLADGTVASVTGHMSIAVGSQERDRGDTYITISDGGVIGKLVGHRGPVSSLTARHNMIISGDVQGEARIWYRTPMQTRGQDVHIVQAFLDRDRTSLVEHATNGSVWRLDTAKFEAAELTRAGREYDPNQEQFERHDENGVGDYATVELKRPRTGHRWVTRDNLGHVWVWNPPSEGHLLCEECLMNTEIAISGDGGFAAMTSGMAVWTYDVAKNQERHYDYIADMLALDNHGERIAFTSNDGKVLVGPLAAPVVVKSDLWTKTLQFTEDERELLVVEEGVVRFIDIATKRLTERKLIGHSGEITYVGRDDQKRYVTLSVDHTARIWNEDGTAIVLRSTSPMSSIVVEGDRALTVERGAVRLWDLATQTSRKLPPTDPVYAAFTASGEIVTVEADSSRVSRFIDPVPHSEAALRMWIAMLVGYSSPR
ncbi:MAG: WD40 repeat domain-containing serine/threonine protein kinase [Kofleriaceae bacterium]